MEHSLKILAPAGDTEMLRAAVFSGADSVYLGLRGFNARRGAANFGPEELRQAVGFCHARNCEVYAAVNTLVLPQRQHELEQAVAAVRDAGCDAIIVQDLAAAAMVRRIAPQLALHASTQMSVHSPAGVRQLAELGFSRVILGRELCEEEIAAIAAESPIELEVFVHGALCVSLSGQCYASAFLGGRSANRGACAGTCRLPFCAVAEGKDVPADAGERYHLSLKDLSILKALPRLERMGIAAAKIEGRLRGPEYCAVAVHAARQALNEEQYDEELLQNVFSRSGFTSGWYSAENDGSMFGVRTEADTAAAKRALPKARELYRREAPRVPVTMHLQLGEAGGSLRVSDGEHTLSHAIAGPLPPAQKDSDEALSAALGKTGGTPFYLAAAPQIDSGGVFVPAAAVAAGRRELLAELLALREAVPVRAGESGLQVSPVNAGRTQGAPPAAKECVPAAAKKDQAQKDQAKIIPTRPRLRAHFATMDQLPGEAEALCDELVLPLEEAQRIPEALRGRTWLQLPRALFGPVERQTAEKIERSLSMGFAGYQVDNLAHLALCHGAPMSAGFGMNAANEETVRWLGALGCGRVTLSPELSLAQARALAGALPADGTAPELDLLVYGHLPLFFTRACPLKAAGQDCDGCQKSGTLHDRKDAALPLVCRQGMRSVYNPVPLWMADRLAQLPCGSASLLFTTETPAQAAAVLRAFAQGAPAQGAFTRGLYDKGTVEG